ncbi:MAG: DivIVA protein [Actinomycetota bacterium]|nr:DivIVA protein [Actinomycetota bacterium]
MDEPGTDEGDVAALVERLEHAHFTVAFRGFEPREVQDFLRSIADGLRTMSLDDIPVAAAVAPVAPKTWPKAEAEAAEIVRVAEEEAGRIVEAALAEAEEIRAEAAALRDQARAATLDAIRSANALVDRARSEAGESGG